MYEYNILDKDWDQHQHNQDLVKSWIHQIKKNPWYSYFGLRKVIKKDWQKPTHIYGQISWERIGHNILSLFAFDIQYQWGQKNKSMILDLISLPSWWQKKIPWSSVHGNVHNLWLCANTRISTKFFWWPPTILWVQA